MYFNRSQKAGRRRVRKSVRRGGRKVGSVKHRRGGSRSSTNLNNNLKKKTYPYVNNTQKKRYAGSLKLFPEWENTLHAAKRAGISNKNNSYKPKIPSRYNYGKLGYKFNHNTKKNVAKLNYRLNQGKKRNNPRPIIKPF